MMWFQLALLSLLFFVDGSKITGDNPVYTNTWVLQINAKPHKVDSIALKHGFSSFKKMYSNYYIFEDKSVPHASSQPSKVHEISLLKEQMVIWFAQQVRQRRVLYDQQHVSQHLLFSDLRWKDQQWYLSSPDSKGMNVYETWKQGFTGKGVVVAVVDDGLQRSHPDLQRNYDPLNSVDFVDLDNNTDPVGEGSGHGNRCGGVIAAVANNSECGVGVAFNAKIAGIRLIGQDDPTDAMEALAFGYHRQQIDIYSCSWGPGDYGWTTDGPKKLASEQLERGAQTGRSYKGSIYVFASGNGGQNFDSCAYNGYANSIYTITVSGVNKDGKVPSYAEPCSAVMASTFSRDDTEEIITTDRNGVCSSTFGKSSAAAAMASGIIALALEANANLTWRDVQHLLVYSSRPDIPQSSDWKQNGAGRWVSNYFGFGLMDASALVNLAKKWRLVSRQVTCVVPQNAVNRVIQQSGWTEEKVTVSKDICGQANTISHLEHVVIILRATFDRRGYLEGYLTSPNGTESHILPFRANDLLAQDFDDLAILSLHFWGENPEGTWQLSLKNHFPEHKFTGTLFNWTLILHGTANDPLERNSHVTAPDLKGSATGAPIDVTIQPPTESKRLSKTVIAVISGSLALFVIFVGALCILVKCGVCRCAKTNVAAQAPRGTKWPEECVSLRKSGKSTTDV